ncbi:MAG: dTDP-4-dehydrorhamnose reductase [Prosthecobacter sp.]|nr:dTDP-4-dehydrorhamnose reductase [Prosthecobacter sp.]
MTTGIKEPLELWGGIECTTNRVRDRFHSQLRRNGHWERIEDLDRIAALGIRTLRYPLLWEELAPELCGRIDWAWADARMERLRALGIQPIIGLIHHGSGPRGTSLIDPEFPEKLAAYARSIAERYPWVQRWTPVNEPLTTARFSGLYGHWYPHGRDVRTFARCLLGQMRATVLAMRAIREVNPAAQLVQTEDLGETTATPRAQAQANFENKRRWLSFDLLTGTLDRRGEVAKWLRKAGVTERELASFEETPCPPGLLGINHYITSSRYLDENVHAYPPELRGGNGRIAYADVEAVRARPEGFCEPERLLHAAWERYGNPLAVTEAHLGCTREEQMRWFAELWNAAHYARCAGVPVTAVTAWSLLGAYDWNSLLTRSEGCYEPGAFDLRSGEPRPTALARMLATLAAGSDIAQPAIFGEPGWWRRRIRILHAAPKEEAPPRPRISLTAYPRPPEDAGRVLLIAGANGTLGQAFARICHLRGLPYQLLSRAEMDIANAASVHSALQTHRPWAVVNAAGFAHVNDAEHEDKRCARENVTGPETLAMACREHDCALLTFSSHLVFNGAKRAPYLESDQVAPLNMYGHSKAAAERRVAGLHPAALIVRTSPFFGPWDRRNFIAATLEKLRAEEPVNAAEDAFISPTYVPDLVHAALDLLIDGEQGIWHLANEGTVSWGEFARSAAQLAGLDPSLVRGCAQESLRQRAPRPSFSALTSERATLMPHWEDALRCCLTHWTQQRGSEQQQPEPGLRAECVA